MVQETAPAQDEAIIELITNKDDLAGVFHCSVASFGQQTKDAIWTATNPRFDTPEGTAEGIARLVTRFTSISTNKSGQPNTLFLKATVGGKIAGFAIWQQASFVDGYGDPPTGDLGGKEEIEKLHPGDEREQRFTAQVFASLVKRRIAYTHEKEKSEPPAIFVLDICAVDPAFQRRGIAGRLVKYGLEEAERRGLEATSEASSMARAVYERLGFWSHGEVHYEVDAEFENREKPSNVFMRTGRVK